VFISPDTDPKTLCPYCDRPLPQPATVLLTRLLDEAFKKSHARKRPANPLGRKAPIHVFANVCKRHEFESNILPQAKAQGWPKDIDWAGLEGRVLNMAQDLSYILMDPGDPIVYLNKEEKPQGDAETRKTQDDGSEPHRSKGPRMRCIFWKNLLADLKESGTKGIRSMTAQFANFEKTQLGYYGEIGSAIIHQVLYDLFPLHTVNPDLISPLTPKDFFQLILVPEVGMRLVIQDMDLNVDDELDKERAIDVLEQSSRYGVAMFPEDGRGLANESDSENDANEEVMGVADLIVMKRALKRRKEILDEEGEEDE
ncbi:RTC4-like domain-containing protein, partial [Mycena epipterygia]